MTVLPQGSEISRRRLLQFGAAAGFLLGTGSLAGCAGPTGLPGPSTLTLALNRSLVSLEAWGYIEWTRSPDRKGSVAGTVRIIPTDLPAK